MSELRQGSPRNFDLTLLNAIIFRNVNHECRGIYQMGYDSITVTTSSPHVGAEIGNVDLTKPL
ncbi:MAG: hypothetical protein ACPGPC_15375, partial [Alphaproteobacteria bacterium]